LLKYIRIGQLETAELFRAARALPIALDELVQDQSLLPAATRIAIDVNHKIYDCLYLALAIERREPLATADRRMAALAQKLNIETHLIEPAL
jgi:predicted nucleic acid-binding protein